MMKDDRRPGDMYWSAIEPFWEKISIYDGPSVFLNQLSGVKREIGLLFAAHWCQSEVCNGGFHQFFFNSTGVLAPEAVEGFEAIGMPICASLVEEAMSFFGETYPRERERRIQALDRYERQNPEEWDPFRSIDDQFFEELDNENGGFARAADRFVLGLAG
jgi:hypothetical protein